MKPNLARDGAAKRLTVPKISPGMVRQTVGDLHPFAHGQALDDTPLQKSWEGRGNVPTHPNMTTEPKSNAGDRLRGTHDRDAGNNILAEAGRLGNSKA